MPARSIWKGSLTFGLVNIPVAVYSMTKSERPRLNQICPRDASQIRYKRWCPKEEREVPYEEIAYGMRIGEEVVTVSKEELDSISEKKENGIEIVQFVKLDEVPPIYFDKPYLLLPQEKMSKKSFALFNDAIARTGRAAIGTVVLREKEHLVVIYPYEHLLIMDTLRFDSEIQRVEPPALGEEITKEERALAKQLVDNLEAEFDISRFKDESSERLTELLETKGTRTVPTKTPEKGTAKARELVDQLKASVKSRRRKLNAHDRKHGLPHARVPVEAV